MAVDVEALLAARLRRRCRSCALSSTRPVCCSDRQLVRDGLAVDGGELADQLHPFADRGADLADVLQRAAEIDVGRLEVRLQPDAVAERIDGAGVVAHVVESRRRS